MLAEELSPPPLQPPPGAEVRIYPNRSLPWWSTGHGDRKREWEIMWLGRVGHAVPVPVLPVTAGQSTCGDRWDSDTGLLSWVARK